MTTASDTDSSFTGTHPFNSSSLTPSTALTSDCPAVHTRLSKKTNYRAQVNAGPTTRIPGPGL
ncbi:hypothetical protein BT96DRAFT_926229 [Gymnopus androsaceus JB14]|uniref:Uncharacterized protein n=1 Tax=Gymnopus androsaceus JB14 TaxID=1447944 RepID=A0A6A4GY18_9AGAR|nr:hypothetical protein BT96DRAFT_926229 [Gymnopus androsaceus JB14]